VDFSIFYVKERTPVHTRKDLYHEQKKKMQMDHQSNSQAYYIVYKVIEKGRESSTGSFLLGETLRTINGSEIELLV